MVGRAYVSRPKFSLYHTLSNVSSKISHKNAQIFYPEFVQYSILYFAVRCDNILVSRGERYKPQGCVSFLCEIGAQRSMTYPAQARKKM